MKILDKRNIYRILHEAIKRFVPVNNKLVFFESHFGKQYSCMPLAISTYLYEHSNFTIVWCFNNPKAYKETVHCKIVRRLSLSYFYHLARAKYFVLNQPLPGFIKLKKNQIFLQTWHGTPLKKIAGDVSYENPSKIKKLSSNWTYLLSQNSYSTEIFRRAFLFDKTIVEEGYPKNDMFFDLNKVKINKIKKQLRLPLNKKIILYAPTWRDGSMECFDVKIDFDKFLKDIGKDWVVVLRLHSVLSGRLKSSVFDPEKVYDFSNYDCSEDLMIVSDVLITDYSSIMFDYSVLNKPIIFYAYDLNDYADNLRGMYLDYCKTVPGPVVKTQESLSKQIISLPGYWEKHEKKYTSFKKRFTNLEDGNVTKRVVERIFKLEP